MVSLFSGARREWKSVLAFLTFSLAYLGLVFLNEYFIAQPVPMERVLVLTFGIAGATFLAAALFSSTLFKFFPKYAKYWTVRRALGVTGTFFILCHVYLALSSYFAWDLSMAYPTLNPLDNPLVFGLIGLTIFFVVSLVSTDWAVSKMGIWWKRIQRLVYFAFWAAIAHMLRTQPTQLLNPAGYVVIALTVLALAGELYWFLQTILKKRAKPVDIIVGIIVIALFLALLYFGFVVAK